MLTQPSCYFYKDLLIKIKSNVLFINIIDIERLIDKDESSHSRRSYQSKYKFPTINNVPKYTFVLISITTNSILCNHTIRYSTIPN